MSLLEIKDLVVKVNNKQVLNGVHLNIEKGEVHILMGPNGSGKSTLIMTLLGYPHYQVVSGKITFAGTELNSKPIHQRVKLGLSVAFQSPPEIRGVKLRDLIRIAGGKTLWDSFKEPQESFATPLLTKVGLLPEVFRDREVNVGFSGGERKRSEVAQIFASKPKLMILDEPDSGVDIDSLKMIGKDLGEYIEENHCACLVVTHYRHILPYLRPDLAHVMCGGRIVKTGDPVEIFTRIEQKGFCEYLELCPPGLKAIIEKEMKND
ncbi:MAG: Fe-S cluster assembly ATPase SufC [bacterium]